MIKKLCAFLLATFLFSSIVSSAEPDKKLHTDCLYPSIAIFDITHGGCGSGVIVRSEKVGKDRWHNVLLTCAHVLHHEDSDYMIILPQYKDWSVPNSNKFYLGHVHDKRKDLDLAIMLFVSKEEMPTIKFGFDAKYFIGTEAFRVGFGLGRQARTDYGKITSVLSRISPAHSLTIRTSIFTVPGDSGGGLFVDYTLVGITQLIETDAQANKDYNNISRYVPLSDLKKWDKEINNEISFVFDKKKPFPVIGYEMIKLKPLTSWSHEETNKHKSRWINEEVF